MSDNILNTLHLDLGARYNRNDKNITYFLDGQYGQYYPVFTLSTSVFGSASSRYLVDKNDAVVDTVKLHRLETDIAPGVTVPLKFNYGTFSMLVQPYVRYNFALISNQHLTGIDIDGFVPDPEALKNYQKQFLDYGLVFLNVRKSARQNIYPKWSQYIGIRQRQSIDGTGSNQFFVDSEWTFPALFPNHNLVFQASFQNEIYGSLYSFSDNFNYSRGYSAPPYDNIYKIGGNYHFPIVYPDFGILGILYLYRIRGNAFVDLSQAHFSQNSQEFINDYNSTGGELMFDTQLFNEMGFSFGVRYSRLLNQDFDNPSKKNVIEFFIPIQRF